MSSQVPVRRTTRTTTRVVNNKENAINTRLRSTTRAKPPSTGPTASEVKPTGIARATASTVATRAKTAAATSSKIDPAAQGKRKREALGEVARPAANVQRDAPKDSTTGLKGKAKAKETFEGVVLKKPPSAAKPPSTTKSVKPPSTTRKSTAVASSTTTVTTTSSRRTRSSTQQYAQQVKKQTVLEEVPEEEEEPEPAPAPAPREEEPMAVDIPAPAPVQVPRRLTVARSSIAVASSRVQIKERARQAAAAPVEIDDDDDFRAYKKRRTSSEAPEDDFLVERELDELHELEPQEPVEADPNGDQWQDLDAEDADDPLMVSEYVTDIFNYLKEVEQTTMPNPNYMEMQKDLAWNMRGILTDWLIQVHSRFRLLPETLFLAVNIIDRFLSQRVVSLAKLQLVGITCLFIAAKVEEIVAPSAQNFLYCADSSYTEPEILQAEKYILKTLDWNMSYPNPMHFLRRASKADDYNIKSRTIAKYFLEIQCLEWRLIAAPPSLVAASALWLARLVVGETEWTPNLAHYSSYPESALIPTANLMLNYVLKKPKHQSFFRKYAGKKFMKSSIYVRDWVLSHWSEGQTVNLAEELPELKVLVRHAKEREERLLAEQAALQAAREAEASREAALADSFEHHRHHDDRHAGHSATHASHLAHHGHTSQAQEYTRGSQAHASSRTHAAQPQAGHHYSHYQGGAARLR